MSFWEKTIKSAKNAGSIIYAEMEKSANETRETRQRYEPMSDEELLKIMKEKYRSTDKDRGVIYSILKSRGYDQDDIKNFIER